jgi:hypothetical protein
MRRRINAVRVGSSNHAERLAELKANHEEFQKMLADGWQVTNTRVKRPRIKRTPQPRYVVTLVFGRELTMTIEEYNTRGQGFKKVREIY